MSDSDAVVHVLLERHGRTYAEELAVDLRRGSPADLFRVLVFAHLASARIAAGLAVAGAQALAEAGWTTPETMRDAGWEARSQVLNRSGYARYDERESPQLGDACELLLERYDGDLRRLRDEAGHDPAREAELLQELKGIGPTGAAVFLREAQVAWEELHRYADERALRVADELGLPTTSDGFAGLVPRDELARLVAALVRCGIAGDADAVRAAGADGSA